jgi:hypothetical protein
MDTSQPKILEVSGEHDNFQGTLAEIGNWSFDGSSSTRQAEGGSSDTCSYLSSYSPTRINGYLVMTEVNQMEHHTPLMEEQQLMMMRFLVWF